MAGNCNVYGFIARDDNGRILASHRVYPVYKLAEFTSSSNSCYNKYCTENYFCMRRYYYAC